jgi:hypothetical protein
LDGCSVEPIQVGWSRLPLCLHGDWFPKDRYPPAPGVHKADYGANALDGYQKAYARYLWEASEGNYDTSFTIKSRISRALLSSSTRYWTVRRFVWNVLVDIMPEDECETYCNVIGEHGFGDAEKENLQRRFWQYFVPIDPSD